MKNTTQLIAEAVKRFREQFNCPIVNDDFMAGGEILNEEIETFWKSELQSLEKVVREDERRAIMREAGVAFVNWDESLSPTKEQGDR